jgi:hypothetical protein
LVSRSDPQLGQQMPGVTVFGEMRTGAMVCGCRDQLIYRITPLEVWIKPLAKLAWFTRWWVDLVWNAGSMQIHMLDCLRLGFWRDGQDTPRVEIDQGLDSGETPECAVLCIPELRRKGGRKVIELRR